MPGSPYDGHVDGHGDDERPSTTSLTGGGKTAAGGSCQAVKQVCNALALGAKTIKGDMRIAYLGLISTLFEAAMYAFVMQWTPALEAGYPVGSSGSAELPLGTIFAAFMAGCMLGSQVFGWCVKTTMNPPCTVYVCKVYCIYEDDGYRYVLLFLFLKRCLFSSLLFSSLLFSSLLFSSLRRTQQRSTPRSPDQQWLTAVT